jgi:TRAP transporter 4TM/12TM fusion protein
MGEKAKVRTSKFRSIVGRWLAISFTIFVIYSMATLSIQEFKHLSAFLAFSLTLIFIKHPINPKKPASIPLLVVDLALSAFTIAMAVYIWVDYWEFIFRVGIPTTLDSFFSFTTVLLVFEATRRSVGWPMLIIAIVFLLYTFFGQYLPEPLSHRGYDLSRITTTFFMTQNGIFGVPLKVMTNFIFLFVAFGAFYGIAGGTQFFTDLATSCFGKLRGGPAKVAIAVSGMMGTISGSAVANTVTTGTLTIPLMKKIGFEKHVAGAVEATASTGGALMPPVMGAAAFVMAEFLGIPYISLCKAALIPALLYYFAIFMIVHFYALKIGLEGLTPEEIPSFKSVVTKNWVISAPLVILIATLIAGYSPRVAVLYAIAATVVVSAFRKTDRMTFGRFLDALAESADNSIMISCACAAAGIIIGIVLMTGIGTKITTLVALISAGSIWLALPIVMVASLLFGMGLPTVVCYVLLAATVAPSLVQLDVLPLAAHLFIYYYGMLCMVTPPVSFAAYAGAAIADADPMKTGWAAWTFALAGFLLPYMFIFDNSLLMIGSWSKILPAIFTATIGIVCLSAAIIGFLIRGLSLIERLLLFAAALALIKPGLTSDMIGAACIALTLIWQFQKARKPVMNDAEA